ncbi:hypothetical protein JCM14469_29330 [Desulfatiferula olefinivorans]
MVDGIKGLGGRIMRQEPGSAFSAGDDRDFSDRIRSMLEDVNDKQHKADADAQKVVKGELGIHEGMISITEADISLRYLVQVRAKVMAAYNEIIKMQI